MEPEVSSPHSQEPATCPYNFILQFNILILYLHILPRTITVLQLSSFSTTGFYNFMLQ
jgi:hypothetical protein